MNQITTRYITEGDACYEQYVISDPAAKTELVITPERGGMISGFSWTVTSTSGPVAPILRVQPPPLRCAGAVPQLRRPGRRCALF